MDYIDLDKQIINIFQNAQMEINNQFFQALTVNDFEKAKYYLSQISVIAEELKNEYVVWAYIRNYMEYIRGYQYSDSVSGKDMFADLQKLGTQTKEQIIDEIKNLSLTIGPVHTEAIKTLIDTNYNLVSVSIDGVNKNVGMSIGNFYQAKVRERLAIGEALGEGVEKQTQNILELFKDMGVGFFRDKAGRKRDVRTYAQMLVRTETAMAYNTGTVNRGLELGYTRFKVIEQVDCCNICQTHNGKIYDFSGQKTIDLPPYHPNCRGVVHIVQD